MKLLLKSTLVFTFISTSVLAFAQDDTNETVEATMAASLAAERAKKRNYPGGRDEQDLTVQASLPQPARAPEAQSQVSTTDETAHD